jgi:hypothetical protein
MDDWNYNNEIKTSLAKKLSHLRISRNLMIQCLEIYYFLETEKLQNIYDNLSTKQKKALQGRALKEIIDFKKD